MPSKPFRKINRLGLLSCLGALISICSAHADTVQISNHPVQALVQRNAAPAPSPAALPKRHLQRMRIMHIDLDYDAVLRETPENVTPAHDGMRIELI